MKQSVAVVLGLVAGAVFGYPISYFFQSGALRAKVSMGGYIEHMDAIMENPEMGPTAKGVWIACIVIFVLAGLTISNITSNRRSGSPL